MSPLRILVLVILFYIGYRLIVGSIRKNKKVTASGNKKPPKEMPTSDILAEDPVCHKLVPQQQAVTLEVAGEKHYFCSQECCETFRNQHGEQ